MRLPFSLRRNHPPGAVPRAPPSFVRPRRRGGASPYRVTAAGIQRLIRLRRGCGLGRGAADRLLRLRRSRSWGFDAGGPCPRGNPERRTTDMKDARCIAAHDSAIASMGPGSPAVAGPSRCPRATCTGSPRLSTRGAGRGVVVAALCQGRRPAFPRAAQARGRVSPSRLTARTADVPGPWPERPAAGAMADTPAKISSALLESVRTGRLPCRDQVIGGHVVTRSSHCVPRNAVCRAHSRRPLIPWPAR